MKIRVRSVSLPNLIGRWLKRGDLIALSLFLPSLSFSLSLLFSLSHMPRTHRPSLLFTCTRYVKLDPGVVGDNARLSRNSSRRTHKTPSARSRFSQSAGARPTSWWKGRGGIPNRWISQWGASSTYRIFRLAKTCAALRCRSYERIRVCGSRYLLLIYITIVLSLLHVFVEVGGIYMSKD